MAHLATREEHPWPAILMHWLHLISIVVLTWTGFYIHRPFYTASMSVHRTLHFVFMFVFILTAIVRLWWGVLGAGSAAPGERRRRRDISFFFPERENRGMLWQTAKYYTFIRRTHPRTAKYNPLQKLTYASWLLLVVLQAVTGFAIWTNTAEFFLPLTNLLGGLQAMRAIHYLIMWLFIITTMIHIYLSVVEAPWQLPLMFAGRERREHTEEAPL